MKPYIKVNNRELTIEQYFENVGIFGESAYAETGSGAATAILNIGSMSLSMFESIRNTLMENGIMIDAVEWRGERNGQLRVWMLIREVED